MRAIVIYESMFGNTRMIARAIGDGLKPIYDVEVRPVAMVSRAELEGVDLIVAGGPTHVRGMSRPSTRAGARKQVDDPGSGLTLEPGATRPGLRELFDGVAGLRADAAAFDTRIDKPPIVTGRASRKIDRLLKRCGCRPIARPESFLVDSKPTVLVAGEEERARGWGAHLAAFGMVTVDRHDQ